ncbi:hypothetical protein [Paraburkholderia sp. GAS333]|uniref:hypothetical protein n=1 Tax=Paraburkholderia sp. GAS333 TaxID=3156279 RepID=UPI003D20B2E0
MPDSAVARSAQLIGGKGAVHGFEFLQAHNVRCFALEPLQQRRQPRTNTVDIESRDPQFRHDLSSLRAACFAAYFAAIAMSHHSIAQDRAHEMASASFGKESISPESCDWKRSFFCGTRVIFALA